MTLKVWSFIKRLLIFLLKWAKILLNYIYPYHSIKSLFLSYLHAVFLFVFSLLWLTKINYFDGFDFLNELMDYKSFVETYVLKTENKSDLGERFLLINTSKNNQIIDQDGLTNNVIVDRNSLIRCLKILDEHSDRIEYIILDVFLLDLDGETNDEMQNVLNRLNEKKKIVIPYYIDDSGYINDPVFDSKKGIAQYKSTFLNKQFVKINYIFSNIHKQTPLVAYEAVTGNHLIVDSFFGISYYKIGNEKDGYKWCLNTIIPSFYYTSRHLIEDETYFQLGYFDENNIGEGQIVLIGDVEGYRDAHHSIVDRIPGPLILLNSFESLVREKNIISWGYFLTLLFLFSIISYHTFYENEVVKFYDNKIGKKILLRIILKNSNYIVVLFLSIISMLCFNIYIHLFVLLGYFAVIQFIYNQLLKKIEL